MSDEEIVAALAEAMREARVGYYTTTAEILLPVVRRIAEQRAAEELLWAADTWNAYDTGPAPKHVPTFLRARAAALTATPNHGRNAT